MKPGLLKTPAQEAVLIAPTTSGDYKTIMGASLQDSLTLVATRTSSTKVTSLASNQGASPQEIGNQHIKVTLGSASPLTLVTNPPSSLITLPLPTSLPPPTSLSLTPTLSTSPSLPTTTTMPPNQSDPRALLI
ncbi:hypothetical protein MRB53_018719 [Persea americana]|uniref:Uncharacterized protein n=1 Tax=Persea americana TaxID=3435 RepID=A0ACC2M8P5_PERAE|nr:hypothetical protein MRB53_018719 [Persea americana]